MEIAQALYKPRGAHSTLLATAAMSDTGVAPGEPSPERTSYPTDGFETYQEWQPRKPGLHNRKE